MFLCKELFSSLAAGDWQHSAFKVIGDELFAFIAGEHFLDDLSLFAVFFAFTHGDDVCVGLGSKAVGSFYNEGFRSRASSNARPASRA